MADDLDELRSRIRIVDLVGQVVRLKKSGRNWSGLCPFHDDKNPSFTVSDETGRYRCWSCGEKGDIFTWVMKTQHVEFPEAIQLLAASIGYTLKGRSEDKSIRERYKNANVAALEFFVSQIAKSPEAKAYLDRRGLDPDTLAKWEIGYAPAIDGALATHLRKANLSLSEAKELFLVDQDPSGGYFDKFRGRIMFPIRDERGQLVAFGGRILGDGVPKYINSSDTPLFRKSKTLYGLHLAKAALEKGAPLVLCEGYLDVIACHRACVDSAVASLGTSLTDEHAKLMARWTSEIVILYDADAAGEKAALRAFEILKKEGLKVRVALMPAGQDPDTLLNREGPGALKAAVEGGLPPATFQIALLERRASPTDETFWRDATEILATNATELEAAELTQKLAAMHPNLRDPKEAYAAVKRMVMNHRRANSGQPQRRQQAVALPKLGLKSAEVALFRGFLSEELRQEAWKALFEPELFATGRGEALGIALREAFPTVAPTGLPANWLHHLGTEDHQGLLTEIQMRTTDPLNAQFFAEALASLRKRREERDFQRLKSESTGDERLRLLHERLTEMRGD